MTSKAALAKLEAQVEAAVLSHKKAKDLKDFAVYADRPADFFREVLRCEPWQGQIDIAESVRDHRRTVVVTGNGLGKDWISARIALWWVYARRGFVILTGPTDRQVKNICMREVRRAFHKAPELPGELLTMELRVDAAGTCGILAFTSDNADKLVGFHHERLLICVTEGQGVEDEAYEAAIACITSPENRLYVYGNPTRSVGSFYRIAHADLWNRLTIKATEHPNVVTGQQVIPGAVSREWINDLRQEYGETSSIFQSRVHARFPEDAVEGLIKAKWVRAANERWRDTKDWIANEPEPMWFALDVARYGSDSSCLSIIKGERMLPLITWRDASVTECADRVEQEFAARGGPKTPRPSIIVDETGLGAGCVDVLRERGWQVTGFNGSEKASDPERFLNLRAESHWLLRDLLEGNAIGLPDDETLREEALAVEWQIALGGQIQIVGKETIKKSIGRSPDRLDAVVMALWQRHAPRPVWGASTFTAGFARVRPASPNLTATRGRH